MSKKGNPQQRVSSVSCSFIELFMESQCFVVPLTQIQQLKILAMRILRIMTKCEIANFQQSQRSLEKLRKYEVNGIAIYKFLAFLEQQKFLGNTRFFAPVGKKTTAELIFFIIVDNDSLFTTCSGQFSWQTLIYASTVKTSKDAKIELFLGMYSKVFSKINYSVAEIFYQYINC